MKTATIPQENHSRSKSSILSLLLFLLLVFALVIPIFSYQIPPPEQEAVLVSFGEANQTGATDEVARENQGEQKKVMESTTFSSKVEEKIAVEKEKVIPKVSSAAAPKLLTSDERNLEAVQKPQIAKKQIDQVELNRLAEESRLKAEQEAAAQKALEQERKFNASKKQFGDLLRGSGKGTNADNENQGDPTGEPDAQQLIGLSKGSGRIGGGLSNRGVLFEPEVKDDSQKTGKVVMQVCVSAAGKVLQTSFTQRGSTTIDGELREKAMQAAKRYKFSESEIEEQCGTITFDFKVE